jgi:hypothetical protein
VVSQARQQMSNRRIAADQEDDVSPAPEQQD